MKASQAAQDQLLAMQQIDSDIIQLEHRIKNLPLAAELDAASASLISSRNLLIAAETEKSDIKHELSKSEVDVEQVVSRIEKDEKRLAAGTGSPKELEQIQHELGSLAKRRSELEEVELEIMVRIEGLDEQIGSLTTEVSNWESEVARLKAQLDSELNELNTAKTRDIEARTELAKMVDTELLQLYEKIRSTSDGVGAARLVGDKCEGCHLTMNSAEVTRIKSLPDDELVRCEECRRILIRVK
ncbi:MAG: zinc ribbon domain-containing protein [Actinomycetales bacterium]